MRADETARKPGELETKTRRGARAESEERIVRRAGTSKLPEGGVDACGRERRRETTAAATH